MMSPQLIDHFQNPRNVGELAAPAIQVEVSNPVCGDELRLSVLFEDSKVAAVRYRIRGCTASIAAGSALTELLLANTLDQITAGDVEAAVGGLPAASKHAAVLCMDAVRKLRAASL
jgi:nitrogen fixation NifU-like protein